MLFYIVMGAVAVMLSISWLTNVTGYSTDTRREDRRTGNYD